MTYRNWASVCLLLIASTAAQAEDLVTVNGKPISKQQVDSAFKRSRLSQRQLTPEESKLYRNHVVKMLIDDELLTQFLDQRQVVADPESVKQHIEQLKAQLHTEGRSLPQLLQSLGIDEKTMTDDISNIHRWEKFVQSQATDSTLRKYFEANRAAFDRTQVRASHILVKVAPDASPTDKQAARAKIDAIRKQLAGGTSFAEAAQRLSDCPSKQVGGDLDYFPRKGVMTEPFAAVAFDLKVGQMSDVVETEFGYHLILVTDRKPGQLIAFENVADVAEELYAEDLRDAIIAQMRSQAQINFLR